MIDSDTFYIKTLADIYMPRIIYGTAWKKERTKELVEKAASLGFKGIDTACQPKHYNEEGVGKALIELATQGIAREQLFLQTKFTPLAGQDPSRIPYRLEADLATQVFESFAVSQKNLQTDYIDSLILHSPLANHRDTMKVWRAMEAIYNDGKTRQLGISNCYSLDEMRQLYDEAKIKPAVLQNRFYSQTGYDALLRKWCKNRGIVYQSFWTLTANPHILESDTIKFLTKKYSKTAAQILFRYLTQIDIAPLTGTCSEEHMRDDLSIFDFSLSIDEIQSIERLFY